MTDAPNPEALRAVLQVGQVWRSRDGKQSRKLVAVIGEAVQYEYVTDTPCDADAFVRWAEKHDASPICALAATPPAPVDEAPVRLDRDIAMQINQKLLVIASAFPGDKQTRDLLQPAVARALASGGAETGGGTA